MITGSLCLLSHHGCWSPLGPVGRPLPDRPVYDPSHPLGCHKPRIADWIIFEKLIQVLRPLSLGTFVIRYTVAHDVTTRAVSHYSEFP